ncbi:MAG TPA: hypothetical protein VGG08_11340, partial [Solirubrobacteraceae bacterium]
RRRPHLRVGRRRFAVVLLAAMALAASAVAERAPWEPWIGNQRSGYPTLSPGAPGNSTLQLLSVLRRPQTELDRDSQVQAVLHDVGPRLQGIHTEYVRNLVPNVAWAAVTLVPVEAFSGAKGTGEALCLLYPTPGIEGTHGAELGCWAPAEITAGAAVIALRTVGRSHVVGLVPDGVASVRVTAVDGVTSVPVRENFFDDSPPSNRTGKLYSRIEWLNAAGDEIRQFDTDASR